MKVGKSHLFVFLSLKISATHLPEKIHFNVEFPPILAQGLFFQIALVVDVVILSTKEKFFSIQPRVLKLIK